MEVYPWYALEGLPQTGIDLLVIDGPPAEIRKLARYPAGPLLFKYLNPGSSVFLDDASRQDEKTILKIWLQEFPTLKQKFLAKCEKGCALLCFFENTIDQNTDSNESPEVSPNA